MILLPLVMKLIHNKKKSKKISDVWDHFKPVKEGDPNNPRCACNYCGASYVYNPTRNGTSTIRAHLSRCKKFPGKEEDKKQKLLSFTQKEESNSLIVMSWTKEGASQHLAKYIILDELPFRHVEGEGFRQYSHYMNPKFDPPSRITIARDIYNVYLDEKKKLKSVMSRERDWGIWKVFTVTVDNASSNDTALQKLKKKLCEKKGGVVIGGDLLHLRCCYHIINLVVGDGLKDLYLSICSICNAVRYVKSSPARLGKFKDCAKEENIQSKALLSLDVPTRWNSTYLMLEAALKFKKAFNRLEGDMYFTSYFDEPLNGKKIDGPPSELDWDNASVFLKFLKIFYEVTLKFSGSLYSTSNLYFLEICEVKQELNVLSKDSSNLLGNMVASMRRKFDKYWGDPEKMNVVLFLGVVLDPRYKLEYIAICFSMIYEETVAKNLLKSIEKNCLGCLMNIMILRLHHPLQDQ
uniref:BED-type domain-containing protein n=1 Tax=Cannabis sativa TaxID=3483 RepID=A0A803PIE6_CANSA